MVISAVAVTIGIVALMVAFAAGIGYLASIFSQEMK